MQKKTIKNNRLSLLNRAHRSTPPFSGSPYKILFVRVHKKAHTLESPNKHQNINKGTLTNVCVFFRVCEFS